MKNRTLVRSLVFLVAVLLAPLLFDGIRELIRWNTTRNYPRLTDSEVRELVQVGMSKDAVHEQLGEPAKKSDGGRFWTYLNRSPNPSDQVSRGFGIQFENDLVTKIVYLSPNSKE